MTSTVSLFRRPCSEPGHFGPLDAGSPGKGIAPAQDPPRSSRPGTERLQVSDPERAALYAELQPLVRRLTRQYGVDPELRQDLEGEIYCCFCQLVEEYDPSRGIPLRAYLVRSLPPAVFSYARTQWRRQLRENPLEAEAVESGSWELADPTREWDDQLAKEAALKALPEAIAQLPLRQRKIVVWRYYESRSFEEIAELLGIRPASVRSLLRYTLNQLRGRIVPGEGGVD